MIDFSGKNDLELKGLYNQRRLKPPLGRFFIANNKCPETPRSARAGAPPLGCRQVSGLFYFGREVSGQSNAKGE
jgi:hypothetical protein